MKLYKEKIRTEDDFTFYIDCFFCHKSFKAHLFDCKFDDKRCIFWCPYCDKTFKRIYEKHHPNFGGYTVYFVVVNNKE